jgi:hypothetical protein
MKLLTPKIIRIGEVDYPVKMSIRAMIMYEQLAGKSITEDSDSLEDVTKLFYCVFRAGGTEITYDEFLNLIDDDIDVLSRFKDVISEPGEKKT